jgi:hypothetical protein
LIDRPLLWPFAAATMLKHEWDVVEALAQILAQTGSLDALRAQE